MSRVLVVEDEEALLSGMVKGLSRLPGLEVHGARSIEQALAIIDSAPPDVVVSDLDLPDRPGVELIGELGRRGLRCPITFVSAYVRAFAAQIPRHAGARVLEKPVSLERLRELVLADLIHDDSPAPFGVADYLQLACMGAHSVRIAVRAHGTLVGDVLVHRGVLWSARDQGGEGVEAFRRLAFASGATVECHAMIGDAGPRSIEQGWESVLLDAARQLDEGVLRAPSADELASFFPTAVEELAPLPPLSVETDDGFDDARERGAFAMIRKDYRAALEALREAERIRPGDRVVAANLARLRELGVDDGGGEP